MNYISRLSIVCGLLAVNITGLSFAAEQLGKEALEALIKGNTTEGVNTKWKHTQKRYFNPDGTFIYLDSTGDKVKGDWRIESDGTLCFIFSDKERCRTIKQRNDGGYNIYNRIGDVKSTIDKVSPGNPHNLD